MSFLLHGPVACLMQPVSDTDHATVLLASDDSGVQVVSQLARAALLELVRL